MRVLTDKGDVYLPGIKIKCDCCKKFPEEGTKGIFIDAEIPELEGLALFHVCLKCFKQAINRRKILKQKLN